MSPQAVTSCFLYVADRRPVLVFENEIDAAAFAKGYHGATIYHAKTHVFIPAPLGLELVQGGPNGETAFGNCFLGWKPVQILR